MGGRLRPPATTSSTPRSRRKSTPKWRRKGECLSLISSVGIIN
jgi:hypothetical protein